MLAAWVRQRNESGDDRVLRSSGRDVRARVQREIERQQKEAADYDPYNRCLQDCPHTGERGALVSDILSGGDGPHPTYADYTNVGRGVWILTGQSSS